MPQPESEVERKIRESLAAVLPITGIVLVLGMGMFQLITKRYHTRQIKRIAVGFVYTYYCLCRLKP